MILLNIDMTDVPNDNFYRNFVVKKNIKGLAKKIETEEAKRKYGKRFNEDKIY